MARWLTFAGLALLAAPAAVQAQDAGALADRFERALVAGDARALPLAEGFVYTENGAVLERWDGMWRTTTALEGAVDYPDLDYRVQWESGDTAIRIAEFEENMVRGVMAYRLVAKDGRIARVDVLPVREEFGGDRGGTLTLLTPMLPVTMDGELVGHADPLFAAAASGADDAAIREGMVNYLEAMVADRPMAREQQIARFSFAADCVRQDNGRRVTGMADAPVLDPAQPAFRPYALGCREQVTSGFYANYELGALEMVTDPARGLGMAFVRLDQPGTLLSFEAPGVGQVAYPGPRGAVAEADSGEQFDGRILTNMISPLSVNGVFVFKFDGGAIRRIDAFYRNAPYGWTAWPAAAE